MKFCIIMLVFFSVSELNAQTDLTGKTDSLRRVITGLQDSAELAQSYKSLAEIFYSRENLDSALSSYIRAERFTRQDDEATRSGLFNRIGTLYYFKGVYDSAIRTLKFADSVYSKTDQNIPQANNLNTLAVVYKNQGKFDQAEMIYTKALNLVRIDPDSVIEARILGNLGAIYHKRGNYNKSLSLFLEAADIHAGIADFRNLGINYHNIGQVYGQIGDTLKTFEYFRKALKVSREVDDERAESLALIALSNAQGIFGSPDSALVYAKKALAVNNQIDDPRGKVRVLRLMANAYLKLRRYDSALFAARRSYDLIVENEYDEELSDIHQTLMECYENLGDKTTATRHAHLANEIDLDQNNIMSLDNSSRFLYEYYAETGDYQKALHYHIQYSQSMQEQFNESSAREIGKLESAHELDQQKKENQLLTRENEIQQKDIEFANQRFSLSILIGFLTIAFSVIVIFLQRSRIKTKKRLRDHEKNLEQMKSDLFLNIAHELRTPLTLIQGPLEDFISSKDLSENEINCFNGIRKNARKLVNMAEEILQVSKLDSEKIEIVNTNFSLSQLIANVLDSFSLNAKQQGIRLNFRSKLNMEVTINSDKQKIERVFEVLVSNALKFNKSGGSVIIDLDYDEVNNEVIVDISDTGVGIPTKDMDRIFDRYYQSSNEDQSRLGGVGIGLSLARNLINALGCTISVSSTLGEGSCFCVTIPTNLPQDTVLANDLQMEPWEKSVDQPIIRSYKPILSDKTILVVEDQPDMMDYVSEILGEKYKVVKAFNGVQALNILNGKKDEIDVIISDIVMPAMDGFELLESVQNTPTLKTIPVILLTTLSEDQYLRKALKIGVGGYLPKPFNRNELLRICDRVQMPGENKPIADTTS